MSKKPAVTDRNRGASARRAGNSKPAVAADAACVAMTAEEKATVARLLKTRRPADIQQAVGILRSRHANEHDWTSVFSPKGISCLVSTWNPTVWKSTAAALRDHPPLMRAFEAAAERAFDRLSKDRKQGLLISLVIGCDISFAHTVGLLLEKFDGELCYDSKAGRALGATVKTAVGHLARLTTAQALCLSKYRFDLYLGKVRSVEEGAYEYLSKVRRIDLRGLARISDVGLTKLALTKATGVPSQLFLGLKYLTLKQAAILGESRRDIALDGLATLSPEAAHALSKCKGELALYGLKQLSPQVAIALSKHQGKALCLGLKRPSAAVVCQLALHRGELWLEDVPEQEVVAKALAGHQGKLIATMSEHFKQRIREHSKRLRNSRLRLP